MPTLTAKPEIILLVDDDDTVRSTVRRILEYNGYMVLEARDGREGLTHCEMCQTPIDLLLTDVCMPFLSGRELADGAVKLRPALRVIFMSGNLQDRVLMERVVNGTAFLQKPFTMACLTQKIRETLTNPASQTLSCSSGGGESEGR